MSLKVLHVIPSVAASEGGPSRALALMERGLTDEGVEVTTLTSDFGFDVHAVSIVANVAGHRVYCPLWTTTYKIAPSMVSYLNSHVRSFDVVHIHALFSFSSTVAAWICRAHRVPYIIRPLGTLSSYGLTKRRKWLKRISINRIEASNLRRAAAVHFTSLLEFEEALQLGMPLHGVVIPIGLSASDSSVMHFRDLRCEYPMLQGRTIILFLSRIDRVKNLESLIKAFAESPLLRERAALIIAGDGKPNYVSAIKALVLQMGIADLTVWLGHVDATEKAAAFSAAHVYCLPSFSENFGIAAVEAMLEGLPLVLGEGAAIAADVEANGAGFSISPDAIAVRNALERLVGDAELAKQMGRAAHQLALEVYSVKNMTRNLIDLYENVSRKKRDYEIQRDTVLEGKATDV